MVTGSFKAVTHAPIYCRGGSHGLEDPPPVEHHVAYDMEISQQN